MLSVGESLKKILFLILAAVTGAGCANQPPSAPVQSSSVEDAIASGVTRIASAYEQLALISSAANSKQYHAADYNYDEELLPEEWLTEVELKNSYHGDLARFISMLSVMGGLEEPRIDAVGRDQPVIISVRKSRRKIISFLADVGYQAGDRALVQPGVNLNKIIVSFE